MRRRDRKRPDSSSTVAAGRETVPSKHRTRGSASTARNSQESGPAPRAPHPAPFPIVGIGASAGGVEALETFFRAMPKENGMAFVVILHLDPKRESLLGSVIGQWTDMPVSVAHDGDLVLPNKVFVISPDSILTIAAGRLHVRQQPSPSGHRAIDAFFESLALDQGENAICIVLSGTGTDGSIGLKSVKEHGGLTLAQGGDGSEARFKEMPSSAEATGMVDLVVPAHEMPARLVEYVGLAPDTRFSEAELQRHAATLKSLYATLRAGIGHDFSRYKEKTFLRRVQRRMQILRIQKLEDYARRLKRDPTEAPLLFPELLIGVTNFFRDREAFAELEKVIPRLFKDKAADDTVRIWVAGCATGEEAYSLALLLREHAETLAGAPRIQVFATDIDEKALTTARAGLYPAAAVRDVTRARLKRFFTREGDSYRVIKEIRDLCVFSSHSLIRDPPFSRLDLVSCRNLLIYLGAELQTQIIPLFHYALRPAGILFLGPSENVSRHGDLFSPLDKRWRIFERQNLVTRPEVPFPILTGFGRGARGERSALPNLPAADAGPSLELVLRRIGAMVQEQYGPAYVVANKDGEVIHYSGRTGKYLEAAEGPPNRDLLGMARKGLRLDLRTALHRARESGEPVRRERVAVQVDGGEQLLTLSVRPIKDNNETLYLVVFGDMGPVSRRDESKLDRAADGEENTVQQLERELQSMRERLQSTVEEFDTSSEELKSSNEELLSVNEELQSANEELETSKEEIQSVNEELQTVNAEISSKVEELDRTNADLRNLFESTQIATIMLEGDLTIRGFTPPIEAVFKLIPSDRGRPLTHIVSRLDQPHIDRDIRAAMARREPFERRVTGDAGAVHYLMRVIPFPGRDKESRGALVTFVDVSNVVRAEEHEKRLLQELDQRVRNTLDIATEIVGRALMKSNSLEDFARLAPPRLAALTRTQELVARHDWADVPLKTLVHTEVSPYLRLTSRRDVSAKGPEIALPPNTALSLGWVLSELAMYAARHGVLTAKIDVAVRWKTLETKRKRTLELEWVERGKGVAASDERLPLADIRERLRRDVRGAMHVAAMRGGGLRCTITIPLARNVPEPKEPAKPRPDRPIHPARRSKRHGGRG